MAFFCIANGSFLFVAVIAGQLFLMFRNKNLLAVCIICNVGIANSQTDTMATLKEVVVYASSLKDQAIGNKFYTWASDSIGENTVADLLQRKGLAYTKNYGPGTLSTSSIKGSSASQTLVLWNGLPVQSPTLGLLDMSLLSLDNNDVVSLESGGNSTIWGSGAVAGVIGLTDRLPDKNAIHVQSSIGSFHTYRSKIGVQFIKSKWTADATWSAVKAKNDFGIHLPQYNIRSTQTNADQSMVHFTSNISFTPRVNHLVTLHYWMLGADRNIPPLLTQTSSTANQLDLSHRIGLHYKILGKTFVINARLAYFKEKNDFRNDTLSPYAKNRYTVKMTDVSMDKRIGSHQILLGLSGFFTEATTDGFSVPKTESRYAIYLSHKFDLHRVTVQWGLRQETANGLSSPIVPGIGIALQAYKNIRLRARISNNFRFPTLNDRYWKPGGNLQLAPESGWSEEIGMDIGKQENAYGIDYGFTVYNRTIKNWIQWGRLKNDVFFSAINLAAVWSRGMEHTFAVERKVWGINAKLHGLYAMNYSTHKASLTSPRLEKGDQLWYVPIHSLTVGMQLIYNRFSFAIDHHFFSATKGINENVSPYNFGNFAIRYRLKTPKSKMDLFLNMDNYLNKNYFILERRPVAGRSIELGIKTNFGL